MSKKRIFNFFSLRMTDKKNVSELPEPSASMNQIQDPAKEPEGLPKDQDEVSRPRKRSNIEQEEVPSKRFQLMDEERFDMTKKDKVNSWSINEEMATYAMTQMNCFISDSDIKDEILKDFPVPENLIARKEMDSNIKSLLSEKFAKETLSLDKAFNHIQERIGHIFGPFSQVWDFIEAQKKEISNQLLEMGDNDIPEDILPSYESAKDCAKLMEMSVTTLGQAFNAVSYYRRRNALMAIMKGDKKKVKDMMTDNKEMIKNNLSERLFGEKFDEKITEHVKLKKKSREFFNILDNKNASNFKENQPFRKGLPLPQREGNSNRGRRNSFFQNNQFRSSSNRIGKSNSNFSIYQVPVLSVQEYPKVHKLVRNLFPVRVSSGLPLAGRVKYFIRNWKRLTGDMAVLNIVNGYQIPLLDSPRQPFLPPGAKLCPEEKQLVDQEIDQMLEKGAITRVNPSPDQFLSNIFTVPKKDGGNRPVINLKRLNSFLHCPHFKMEGLFLVRELLSPNDWMCKVDLKDAYFSIPIHQSSQKYLRFEWEGSLYQFLCLCFGLSPAPLVFTKLMKIPIALLRKLKVKLIIYLDDILLMAPSKEELEMGRDTLIFILQHLGFVINVKKSVLDPTRTIEFLGIVINSVKMELSLSRDKIRGILTRCHTLLDRKLVSIRK